jgi:hypothetical protein
MVYKSKFDLLKHFAELELKLGAEIGVSQGYFSKKMFEAIPNLKLFCVDAWLSYPGVRRWMPNNRRANLYYEITKKTLALYNAVIMRGMSVEMSKQIPDGSLDFVFIDANHAFDYVMEDLIHWVPKVRSGGIVSGDDYFHFKKSGVIEAVDAYTKAHGIKFELTDPLTDKIQDRGTQEQPVYWWVKQ